MHASGTIPAVTMFKQILDLETVLLGFGLPADRIHTPE